MLMKVMYNDDDDEDDDDDLDVWMCGCIDNGPWKWSMMVADGRAKSSC